MPRFKKIISTLSALLAFMIAGISLVGMFTPNFYAQETLNWQVQSGSQDIIDLILITPVFIATTLLTLKFRPLGFPIWGGVILYLIYTFTIYSFDVHFNNLFIFYCLTLGLAFYSFLYFIHWQLKSSSSFKVENTLLRKVIGIYFITIATLLYSLWLSEILPSHRTPNALTDAGLPTNPVHVLDLAIILPGMFITGILLLKNKRTGLVLAPVFLMFFILMNITIGTLSIVMQQNGLGGSSVLTSAMGALALFSLALLIWFMKKIS